MAVVGGGLVVVGNKLDGVGWPDGAGCYGWQ